MGLRSTPILFLASITVFSCARNLKEDITLNIDEIGVEYRYGTPTDPSYLNPGDSTRKYDEIMRDLGWAFRDKGNDVTVISSQGDFTLRMVTFSFGEYKTGESAVNPCDSNDTLAYVVSVISGFMKCEVIDNFTGQSVFIEADAESDEDVKNHPTIFQRLIGNDSCYTPRVSSAYPEAVERRLVRRIHRRAMQAIKCWQ